jgi:hypothetical protein
LLGLVRRPREDPSGHHGRLGGHAGPVHLGAHPTHGDVVGCCLHGELGQMAGQAEIPARRELRGAIGEHVRPTGERGEFESTAEAGRGAPALREITGEVTTPWLQSVCQVLVDHRPVCLATVIDASGVLLAKDSDVGRSSDAVEVTLPVGTTVRARRVARDRDLDLVVLKVDGEDLVPIEWSDEAVPISGTPGSGRRCQALSRNVSTNSRLRTLSMVETSRWFRVPAKPASEIRSVGSKST